MLNLSLFGPWPISEDTLLVPSLLDNADQFLGFPGDRSIAKPRVSCPFRASLSARAHWVTRLRKSTTEIHEIPGCLLNEIPRCKAGPMFSTGNARAAP
jgi:hypothetical protein